MGVVSTLSESLPPPLKFELVFVFVDEVWRGGDVYAEVVSMFAVGLP